MPKPKIRELLQMARSEDRDDAFDGAHELASRVEAVLRRVDEVYAKDGHGGLLAVWEIRRLLNGEPL